MKITVFVLFFLIYTTSLQAQIKLYGQYVAGDSKEAVSKYDRTMRLNGIYYYIEPHFNDNDKLYMIRIINYDFVTLADYHVVLKHAERLVELMEFKYGTSSRNKVVKDSIRCGVDTPYAVAFWKMNGKDIQIDIECKDERYFHIIYTISTISLSTDNRSQLFDTLEN
jgi:hypothetical protein